MEMLDLSLPAANRFATDYLAGSPELQSFFHYNFIDKHSYEERVNELKGRSFMRNELADHIQAFMSRYAKSEKISANIDKLRHENSVAVIGGQQAGILTGPLYTIHKVISIIKLAEQKEAELGVPVVPVFWIAGEDHDYHEVNHVFVMKNNKQEKWIYPEKNLEKKMISEVCINKDLCYSWVEEIMETYGETKYTKEVLAFALDALKNAESFVDFFAMIIMELFKDSGLLIVDSGNKELRKLEKEYFVNQIKSHREITSAVLGQQERTQSAGFSHMIDISEQAANLFFYDEKVNERILLQFDPQSGGFTGKNGEISFTYDELVEMANEYPEKLSNNVVTRPLMQEWLFPTLAFIGGPGEIAYWAELKMAFEHFGLKMPPLVPRLNITLLERSVESDMEELGLDLQEVLISGTGGHELKYIDSLKDREVEELFENVKTMLIENYQQIREKSTGIDPVLKPMLEKNESILMNQIGFMEDKIVEAVCRKNDHILRKFTRIENALRPGGSPQERVWNPFYYLNRYGLSLVPDLLKLHYEFDGTHKIIKL
ncbi:bacillithiol biosynthesis cysteine-adding enzyme BshC [Mesobacillus subterraneus]|uniref:Putative cysteine ligase BshC n=1 Tax=Mesobacillus subterraneus TaxID=285983 RepID=A0A427TUL6_9BACI|nr:bacillithiol biosynthesis cysteine-adding enzyme BshC [Mesobacillus subterraneus]RSD28118.1 bacillithiol biosynthesis cysteine-adding enzyme BshC [Mesobacillus subterraneus]